MKHSSGLALGLSLLSTCVATPAQEPTISSKDRVTWAQEFLRRIYPGLNGRKLVLTVETSIQYDEQPLAISWLSLDVGEAFKYWLKGYAGCLSEPPVPQGAQSQLPLPRPATTPPPSKEQPSEPCKPGPMYPKQFLSVGFQFDKDGHLASFGADGPFIDDRKADAEVYEIVRAHPEMTYAQVVATMKQHGTRYGPEDKQHFIEDAPWKQLEPFLGRLQIVSVNVPLMDKEPNPVPWVDRWLSPDWTVRAQGTLKDGTRVPYELTFSHLNGYLIGLLDCRASPWCNKH